MPYSKNYIWDKNDRLGKGAQGEVFKARHQVTGNIVAVKVLAQADSKNPDWNQRIKIVNEREIDIMKKCNHKNIVRLIEIENTLPTIIAMELCIGGSLHDILQKPENLNGLSDKEFSNVLFDLAAAIQYLRSTNIVHRDIKPGNIMCQIDEYGRYTYKLIDFGGARTLQTDEQYTSIVGTVEYLEPDVYRRGVVREPNSCNQFGACVDLWSLGVTIYQSATGCLPFIPFEGCRNDIDTMFNMISKKPNGIISAKQLSKGGPIEYSDSLPDDCNLSRGLKNLITPLLQGLICSKENIISFEDFFKQTDDIKQKIIFFIFNATTSEIEAIYTNKDNQLEDIQKHIAELTNTSVASQTLLFENLELNSIVPNNATANMFPKTLPQNPIFMFGTNIGQDVKTRQFFSIQLDLEYNDNDYVLILGLHLQSIYNDQRIVKNVLLRQQLIIQAAKMFQLWFDRKVGELKDDIVRMRSLQEETGKRIESTQYFCHTTKLLLDKCNSSEIVEKIKNSMKKNDASLHLKSFERQKADLNTISTELENLYKDLIENKNHWLLIQSSCQNEDGCQARIDMAVKLISNMKKTTDKKIQHLEIKRMKQLLNEQNKYIESHCIAKLIIIFNKFNEWYCDVLKWKQVYNDCLKKLANIERRHSTLTTSMNNVQMQRQKSYDSDNHNVPSISFQPMPQYSYVVPRKNNSDLIQQLNESLSTNYQLQASIISTTDETNLLLDDLSKITQGTDEDIIFNN